MARFSEHRLRPEEELGGFEPDADQDETFLLERLPQYPGELGRYMPENAEDEPVIPQKTDAQSVAPVVAEEPAVFEEVPPLAAQDAPVEFEEVAPAVALDEDFLQSLRNEVAEAEERKSQQDVSEYINFQAPPSRNDDFVLDEATDAQVFDLADIDAQHPSSYNLQSEGDTPEPVVQEPVIPPVDGAENEATEVREEERRKRSVLPWLAAALVLLALAGAGGWWLLKNSTQTKPVLALKKDSLRVTTENGVAPEIIKDTAALARVYNDSLQRLAYNDSLKNIAAKSDSLKTIALAAATVNKSTEKTADVLKETPKINPNAANPGLTVKPAANTSRTVREVRPKEPVLQRSENGLYMVQVYSSPSREDAEDWLARLRERNAGNAVVTSQNIRGQQWYRVRFGSYPTRTEAENAALKLGFAQSWIVQIR